MRYCMIETAFDNKEELEKVVTKLLDNKLVSGCQVVESNSTGTGTKNVKHIKNICFS